MDLDQLASFLRTNVHQDVDDDPEPEPEPAPPSTDTPPAMPKTSNWQALHDTVVNKQRDMRVRKTAFKKMVGTMNRMFPIVATARNRDDLTKEMVTRVHTLAELMQQHPGICKSNNIAPGMHTVISDPTKIEAYVHDRVKGKVDGRVRSRFNAHYFDLFTQTACVMLESFKITSLDALQTACSKMTSLELLRGSVSARSLLSLLSLYMQISADTVLQIVNAKQTPADLPMFAFSFFSNVKKQKTSDCVLNLYECSLAQLSDLRKK